MYSNTTLSVRFVEYIQIANYKLSGRKTLVKIMFLAYSVMYWILGLGPRPHGEELGIGDKFILTLC